MKRFFVFLLSLSFCFSLSAMIIEHTKFDAILTYLNEDDLHRNTIIIIDIDNTIAHPHGTIGSEEWFMHLVNQKLNEGLSIKAALEEVLPLYFAVHHSIWMQPVEAVTPVIIKYLQQSGVIVIAVTARSLEIRERTFEQLDAIGVDFSHAPLWHEEILSDSDLIYHYKDGILFCAGNDKGKVLKAILDHINHTPTKVIAIDDKEKHLHAIKKIFEPHVEFIGIRYGHLDEKVAQFDPIIAEQELEIWKTGYLSQSYSL